MGLVVVTGVSRGFGYEVASAFVQRGFDVVGVTRRPADGLPAVRWVVWDVTNDDATPLIQAVSGQPVDVLVNNAGIGCPESTLAALSISRLQQVMDVNVHGVIRTTQALLSNLNSAARPLVLNISSRLGSVADQAAGVYAHLSTSYAYRISKAAQNMLTVSMANEFGPHLRVWAVHPGQLATSMGRAGSAGSPVEAGHRLVELAASGDPRSPRFCALGQADLPW